MMQPEDWNALKYFKAHEFACKCGECDSDGNEMDPHFMSMLNQLRERFGFPLVITSGYRCPAYNERISTTGRDGPHTTGRAADLHVVGKDAFRLVQQCGLGDWMLGIGIHQRGPHQGRFIHLDDLTHDGRPWIWTY